MFTHPSAHQAGDAFYIIEEGEVVCTKNKDGVEVEVSQKLGSGAFFGELSLLNDDVRAATVKVSPNIASDKHVLRVGVCTCVHVYH